MNHIFVCKHNILNIAITNVFFLFKVAYRGKREVADIGQTYVPQEHQANAYVDDDRYVQLPLTSPN